MARQRYYDWQSTFSRQTGTQGEVCLVIGAKGIGKTFGLRLQCVKDYIKRGYRFCELCRTKTELKSVARGYFDKLEALGAFPGYIFKTSGQAGYIAKEPKRDRDTNEYKTKPKWEVICYFVALSNFQTEKKRTYANIHRYIFDECIIDRKDRYHRYLPDEIMIFGNLLDSISRQQPGDRPYKVYLLGNACDLTSPYLRWLGIDKVPESYGYYFYRDKSVLLHYVQPWDKAEREAGTLVGRLLSGTDESEMVFGNRFLSKDSGDVCAKPIGARYIYGIVYGKHRFAVHLDYRSGLCWISSKLPKGEKNIYSLTKEDATLDYQALERTDPYLKSINKLFYSGSLRYDSPVTRELFLSILDFLGIR